MLNILPWLLLPEIGPADYSPVCYMSLQHACVEPTAHSLCTDGADVNIVGSHRRVWDWSM